MAPQNDRALSQRFAERLRERSRAGLCVDEHIDAVQDDFLNFLDHSSWTTATPERRIALFKPLLRFYMPSPTRFALGLRVDAAKLRGKVPLDLTSSVQQTVDAAWVGATAQFFADLESKSVAARAASEPVVGNLPIEDLRHQAWCLQRTPRQNIAHATRVDLAKRMVLAGAGQTGHAFKVLSCWLIVENAPDRQETASEHKCRVLTLRVVVLQVLKQLKANALGDCDEQKRRVAKRLCDAWNCLEAYTQQCPAWFADGSKRWKAAEDLLQAYLDECSDTCVEPMELKALFQQAKSQGHSEILRQCRIAPDQAVGDGFDLLPSLKRFDQHLGQYLLRPSSIPKPAHQLWYGPPGIGKTEAIKILAKRHRLQLFGWEDGNGLNSEFQHKTAEGRADLLDQANAEAKRSGRLALVAFDEAHVMFPELPASSQQHGEGREDAACMQRVLQGLQGDGRLSHIVVIACTNYLDLVAAPLRDRLTCVKLEPPAADFQLNALNKMVQVEGFNLSPEQLSRLGHLMDGMALRPLSGIIREAKVTAMLHDAPGTSVANTENVAAAPAWAQTNRFYRHLETAMLNSRVASTHAEIFDLEPLRGKGFRARFSFEAPIACARAYVQHGASIWLLQWENQPETGGRQVLGRRLCGEKDVTAANLVFTLPCGDIRSTTCRARLSQADADTWKWPLDELEQLQPGTSEFTDLFISHGKLRCVLDMSFEPGGFLAAPTVVDGAMAAGQKLFAGAAYILRGKFLPSLRHATAGDGVATDTTMAAGVGDWGAVGCVHGTPYLGLDLLYARSLVHAMGAGRSRQPCSRNPSGGR